MKHEMIALLMMAMPFTLAAQESDENVVVCADRPGMASGIDIMHQGRWELEQGMEYNVDKTDEPTNHLFNFSNTVLRYGLSKNTELRVQLDGLYMHSDNKSVTGLGPMIFGTKVKIFESSNALPDMGILAQLTIPTGKREFRPDHIAPQLYAIFSNDLSDKVNLTYNVGLEWDGLDGEENAPTTFLALCGGYSPNDNLGLFVEGYGYLKKHTSPLWYVDAGTTLLVSPRVQLDLYGGLLLSDFGKNLLVGLGVSWLL